MPNRCPFHRMFRYRSFKKRTLKILRLVLLALQILWFVRDLLRQLELPSCSTHVVKALN